MSELTRLKNQLDQLEKTYKAGIIGKEEYETGKANIDKKLRPLLVDEKKKQESKKIVEDIITKKPEEKAAQKEKKAEKKEPASKEKASAGTAKTKAKAKKSKKTKAPAKKIAAKNKKDDEPRSWSSVWIGILVFALVIIIILMIRQPGTDEGSVVQKNLSGINTTAAMTIYSSYSCTFCKDMEERLQDLKIMYGDHIIIDKRHYPLDLEKDVILDMAAECFRLQSEEDMQQYETLLYNIGKPATADELVALAEMFDINSSIFRQCINDEDTLPLVVADYKSAIDAKIDRVPAVILDGAVAYGVNPLGFYEAIIDSQLQE